MEEKPKNVQGAKPEEAEADKLIRHEQAVRALNTLVHIGTMKFYKQAGMVWVDFMGVSLNTRQRIDLRVSAASAEGAVLGLINIVHERKMV